MARAARALLLPCLCAAALGCLREEGRVARVAERARPHLRSFGRFDRWARRALVSPPSPRERDALAEVVFAPIRNAPGLLAAWVRREGDRPFTLALPPSAEPPSQVAWVALRDPELGALRAASLRPCTLALPSSRRSDPDGGCVLITRTERIPGARSLTVTLAFRADASGPGAARAAPGR